MQLLLKDDPIMDIQDNGTCRILDFERLPFALRRENVTFIDFMEWASNRTLSISRSFAKEILNALRLSQNNRFAVCKACRGVSLTDSYWIRQENDDATWADVNLFQNSLSLFMTEISLSGRNVNYHKNLQSVQKVYTPEFTTMGVSAKSWIRRENELYLHKVGKYEIPADEILSALDVDHISYTLSAEEEIGSFLSEERKMWLDGVDERMVCSKLFTSEDTAMITFEEFSVFCNAYGLNPYHEAMNIDRGAYLDMQIADYLLNNSDRHEQNWGFFMDNQTGKITGFCPLFDHDRAFSIYSNLHSQTTAEEMTLFAAAKEAWRERKPDLICVEEMTCPRLLTQEQWQQVLGRAKALLKS